MMITRGQLRRIVKEEARRLREGSEAASVVDAVVTAFERYLLDPSNVGVYGLESDATDMSGLDRFDHNVHNAGVRQHWAMKAKAAAAELRPQLEPIIAGIVEKLQYGEYD